MADPPGPGSGRPGGGPEPTLDLRVSRDGAVLVVSPVGRLDSRTGPQLEALLSAQVAAGERRLLLDCARLRYLSSGGLRAVMVLTKYLRDEEGMLVVCGMKPCVADVFRMSGLDGVVAVHPDRAAALAALA